MTPFAGLLLVVTGAVLGRDDGDCDPGAVRAAESNLCCKARTEAAVSWEGKTSQPFEDRAFAAGLVSNNDELGQSDVVADATGEEPVDLLQEGEINESMRGAPHCSWPSVGCLSLYLGRYDQGMGVRKCVMREDGLVQEEEEKLRDGGVKGKKKQEVKDSCKTNENTDATRLERHPLPAGGQLAKPSLTTNSRLFPCAPPKYSKPVGLCGKFQTVSYLYTFSKTATDAIKHHWGDGVCQTCRSTSHGRPSVEVIFRGSLAYLGSEATES